MMQSTEQGANFARCQFPMLPPGPSPETAHPAPPTGVAPWQQSDSLLDFLGAHMRLLGRILEERPSRSSTAGVNFETRFVLALRNSSAPLSSMWLDARVPPNGFIQSKMDTASSSPTHSDTAFPRNGQQYNGNKVSNGGGDQFYGFVPSAPCSPEQEHVASGDSVSKLSHQSRQSRTSVSANAEKKNSEVRRGETLSDVRFESELIEVEEEPADMRASSEQGSRHTESLGEVPGQTESHQETEPVYNSQDQNSTWVCQDSKKDESQRSTYFCTAVSGEEVTQRCSTQTELVSKSRLKEFSDGKLFQYTIQVLILLNAVLVGLEAHLSMSSFPIELGTGDVRFFEVSSWVFTTLFTLELMIRGSAEGILFFDPYAPNFGWNIFDFVAMLGSFTDIVVDVFLNSTSKGTNTSYLRLLRVTKIVRITRALRVLRFFKDLRIIITGILSSMKSLFWALVLLTFIMYIVAVAILQIAIPEIRILHTELSVGGTKAVAYISTADENDETSQLNRVKEFVRFFGSIPESISTLYSAILGGIDWNEGAMALDGLSPYLRFLFMVYVAFSILCVLNIVTGVFVENAYKITQQDEEYILTEELNNRSIWENEVKQLFINADKDGNLKVDWQEFQESLKNKKVQLYFRKIGLNVETESAPALFRLLDFDGDGSVELEEFIASLNQIHGNARSIDIVRVQHELKNLKRDMREVLSMLEDGFSELGLLDNKKRVMSYSSVPHKVASDALRGFQNYRDTRASILARPTTRTVR